MSLTKDKQAAKTALETLRQVETMLDVETRQRYRHALDAVAKYNDELRRDRSTIVALADAATRPRESPREAEHSREIQRLQSENRQLREQVERERNRPICLSEDLIYAGLNKLANDEDFDTLCRCAQLAALKAIAAVRVAVKDEAPSLESVSGWARRIMETIIEILHECAPELSDKITLTQDTMIIPYSLNSRPN